MYRLLPSTSLLAWTLLLRSRGVKHLGKNGRCMCLWAWLCSGWRPGFLSPSFPAETEDQPHVEDTLVSGGGSS